MEDLLRKVIGEEDYIGPKATCEGCGKRATGFATINDKRYCHGSFDPSPTCYMKAQVTR
jgi:hypothetical protein